ncbi:hypothetical protein BDW68DRAFT_162348 [Aspergillus falconensis]
MIPLPRFSCRARLIDTLRCRPFKAKPSQSLACASIMTLFMLLLIQACRHPAQLISCLSSSPVGLSRMAKLGPFEQRSRYITCTIQNKQTK